MSAGDAPDPQPSMPPDLIEAVANACFRSSDPAASVEQLCRQHPGHADAIRRAVANHETEWTAATFDTNPTPLQSLTPTAIGPYTIESVLGEGGMGTVYRAKQREPVRRTVAVKVIKLGMDSREVMRRFEFERLALAAMSHSCIARVFDAGTTERGQPYFVMEFVEGVPLTDWCDRQRLDIHKRLAIFREVCAGVQHAHQKGIIHRDLKPGNILVTREGDRAIPKVLDFGLAKATGGEDFVEQMLTRQDAVMGTPEYMAPEQASGGGTSVDTRADVYSLGVILYELLSGELPFASEALRAGDWSEVRRILGDVEPAKPSSRVQAIEGAAKQSRATARGIRNSALVRELQGDLDWIVMKAIAKEPERRFDSAAALAEDLRRYVEHEPVVAGPPSYTYRIRKLMRRYRGQVIAIAVVVLTAVVGAAVAVQYALEADAMADKNASIARAEKQASMRALQNLEKFESKVDEFNLLAGALQTRALIEGEPALHPVRPASLPALQAWRERAEQVLARKPRIEQTIADLQQRIGTGSPAGERTGFADSLERDATRYLLRSLEELLGEFATLTASNKEAARSLAWAEQVLDATFRHPAATVSWQAARKAIATADGVVASELYADMTADLSDDNVLGLVPIGMNPVTGLWEFYDLRSAWDGEAPLASIPIPTHDERGHVDVGETTGILFVLLPGGRIKIGTQNHNPDGPHYDEFHRPLEGVHRVTLAPFLMARHELTQGQWSRLWPADAPGSRPSNFFAGRVIKPENASRMQVLMGFRRAWKMTLANPVERVSWDTSTTLLARHGLRLPTEAQWEYACRAGTTTPWCVPQDELATVANLRDATHRKADPTGGGEDWSDKHLAHAPVGSFDANAFGMHDMHGNVWEWCRDGTSDHYGGEREGDGLRDVRDPIARITRGGSYFEVAKNARSSVRNNESPNASVQETGLRAVRLLSGANATGR